MKPMWNLKLPGSAKMTFINIYLGESIQVALKKSWCVFC